MTLSLVQQQLKVVCTKKTAGDMIRNNLFKGFNVTVLACKYEWEYRRVNV